MATNEPKAGKKTTKPKRKTPASTLTIDQDLKTVAEVYGRKTFGSFTAYVEKLLRDDLTRLGFEFSDSLEDIAKQAGVRFRKPNGEANDGGSVTV